MSVRFRYLLPFMMYFVLGGAGIFSSLTGEVTLPHQNLAHLTPKQWNAAFAEMEGLALAHRVAVWADLAAVGAEYVRDPLGEGPGKLPDPDPLVDFAHVDCQTYIEQVYALTLSHNRKEFDDTLRRIRYKDGQVDFRWRNHYTVTDWLPANAWFLHDATDEVGQGMTRSMTKTISHAHFFIEKGLPQYGDIPDVEQETHYIPRAAAKDVAAQLHTGDMIILVVSNPGIIAGHVGLIRNPGVVSFQHASLTEKRVVTVPFVDYVNDMPERFVGFKVARLN